MSNTAAIINLAIWGSILLAIFIAVLVVFLVQRHRYLKSRYDRSAATRHQQTKRESRDQLLTLLEAVASQRICLASLDFDEKFSSLFIKSVSCGHLVDLGSTDSASPTCSVCPTTIQQSDWCKMFQNYRNRILSAIQLHFPGFAVYNEKPFAPGHLRLRVSIVCLDNACINLIKCEFGSELPASQRTNPVVLLFRKAISDCAPSRRVLHGLDHLMGVLKKVYNQASNILHPARIEALLAEQTEQSGLPVEVDLKFNALALAARFLAIQNFFDLVYAVKKLYDCVQFYSARILQKSEEAGKCAYCGEDSNSISGIPSSSGNSSSGIPGSSPSSSVSVGLTQCCPSVKCHRECLLVHLVQSDGRCKFCNKIVVFGYDEKFSRISESARFALVCLAYRLEMSEDLRVSAEKLTGSGDGRIPSNVLENARLFLPVFAYFGNADCSRPAVNWLVEHTVFTGCMQQGGPSTLDFYADDQTVGDGIEQFDLNDLILKKFSFKNIDYQTRVMIG